MEIITAIGTILGIIAVMLARDFRDGKNMFKKNSNDMSDTAHYLKEHYNDTLTALLTEIQIGQSDIKDILKDIERNGVRIRK